MHKSYLPFVCFVLIVFGCSQNDKSSRPNNSIDEEIKTIEVDSLRKVNLFYRDVNTLIMRCYIDDSCRYIQLISKRKNDVLLVKHKKNWINIDSVGHYYCFFPLA